MFNQIGTPQIAIALAILALGVAIPWIIYRVVAPADSDQRTMATPRPLPRDLADRLAQLAQLYEAGSLTDVEFEAAKNAALEGR